MADVPRLEVHPAVSSPIYVGKPRRENIVTDAESEAAAVLARCIREGRQFAYDPVEGPEALYCVDDEFAPSAAAAYSRALSAHTPEEREPS